MISTRIVGLKDFDNIKSVIKRRMGFDCSFYSDTFLQRRIDVRMRATKTASYKDYAQVIESNPSEQDLLRKELTIHTTNFFRDSSTWAMFQKEVIPEVAKSKTGSAKKIRVWCIGCSTGEEPLTVAICFFEALGWDLGGFQLSILATDLDAETIKKANEAKYEGNQFKEMDPELRSKYFIETGGYHFPIPKIKSVITYKEDDVFSPARPKGFDVIFCRNTVIYFDTETKAKLYVDLLDCLQPAGFFIMGKTEMLMGPARDSYASFNLRERFYRKDI